MNKTKLTKDLDFTFSINGIYFGHCSLAEIIYKGTLTDGDGDEKIEILETTKYLRLEFKNKKPDESNPW